jgi:ABC-type amino acid transport substrate-binding protein
MLFVKLAAFLFSLQSYQAAFNLSFSNHSHLTEVTLKIIREVYLKDFTTVNVIRAFNDSSRGETMIDELIKNNDSNNSEISVFRLDSFDNIQTIKNRKKNNNVIYIDTIESFRVLNNNLIPKIFSYRGFYLFVLVGKRFALEEIFESFWSKNIFNVNVLVEHEGVIDVISFLPFGGSKCGDTSPRVIQTIRPEDSFKVTAIFPQKFKNLLRCPMSVATFDDELSVIREKLPDGSLKISGFDVEVLNEIASSLNFKPILNFVGGLHPTGALYKNGTIDGAIGELVKGNSEIAMGRYYLLPFRLDFADSSLVYFTFPEVFVVSPGRKLTALEKLLRPFDSLTWTLLAIFMGFALLVIFMINMKFQRVRSFVFGRGVQNPLTNLLIGFYGGSQTRLPGRNFSRFLLMMWLILCLIIRNTYQGSLFKFLQSDETSVEINKIDDLIELKYDLYVKSATIEMIFGNSSSFMKRLDKF